jgi:Flp pilus assembly protein TadG
MFGIKKLFGREDGTSVMEFALVAPALFGFVFGIIQTGYVLWIDNLLHYSVDVAARCGAVASTTSPCKGGGFANMEETANALFAMAHASGSPTFDANCSATGSGLTGTYEVSFLSIVNLTLTAKSCYPGS